MIEEKNNYEIKGSTKFALHWVTVEEAGIGVGDVDGDELPVGFALVDHAQHAQHLHLHHIRHAYRNTIKSIICIM